MGIDFEVLGRIRADEVMAAALTPSEASWFAPGGTSGDDTAREELLLRIWCAKEAAAKCLGVGFAGGPQLFEVAQMSDARDRALVRYVDHTIPVLIRRDDELIIALANVAE